MERPAQSSGALHHSRLHGAQGEEEGMGAELVHAGTGHMVVAECLSDQSLAGWAFPCAATIIADWPGVERWRA